MRRETIPALLLTAMLGGSAAASAISVTIENLQEPGGFSFTPFWLGFHDGTFDVFDEGFSATMFPGLTELAELGDTSVLSGRFGTAQPAGVQQTITEPNGAPVFSPGESVMTMFDLDGGANAYMNFAAMVVPSNDLFVGNDLALRLFDDGGQFIGPMTIDIYGRNVWDNGSEANDILNGGAFVEGVDGTLGQATDDPISLFFSDPGAGDYLDSIIGLTTADGGTITRSFDEDTLIGRITIVPGPGPAAVLALLAVLPGARRRRR